MSWIPRVFLLLATFTVKTRCQQECSDYNVSVSQADYLLGHDVKLACRVEGYADTKITTVAWRYKQISLLEDGREAVGKPVYHHLEGHPQYTQGVGDFEERVTGEFREQTHTLTLHNATDMDAVDHTWICTATTKNCWEGSSMPSAEL